MNESKFAWRLVGSANIFKLTPPWRADGYDAKYDVDLIMIVPQDEGRYSVFNAVTVMPVLENCISAKTTFEEMVEELGWPCAGIAHPKLGERITYTYEVNDGC